MPINPISNTITLTIQNEMEIGVIYNIKNKLNFILNNIKKNVLYENYVKNVYIDLK